MSVAQKSGDNSWSDSDQDNLNDMTEFSIGTDPATANGVPSIDGGNVLNLSINDSYHQVEVSGGSGRYAFASKNSNVATVNSSGRLTAISVGSATITVTDLYLPDTSIELDVTVHLGEVPVSTEDNYILSTGWNMIGGKDASDSADITDFMSEYNINSVWHWDGQWKSYIEGTPEFLNSLFEMEASKGYFVNVGE